MNTTATKTTCRHSTRRTRLLNARLTALVSVLFLAQAAWSHAMLERASPPVGSSISSSPQRVELHFSEEVEVEASSIQVIDSAGTRVDRNDQSVDRKDPRILRVSVPPLAPGRYRVLWRALSEDSDKTEGDYSFELAP